MTMGEKRLYDDWIIHYIVVLPIAIFPLCVCGGGGGGVAGGGERRKPTL